MSRYAAMIAAALILVAADEDNDKSAKEALKKLEGTWSMVSGEEEGKEIQEETIKSARLVIKGTRHTVKVGDDTFVGTHAVDPSKKPKAIHSKDTSGRFKDKTILGIYEIEGDELKVCFAPPDKERPTEFTTKSGTGTILHVWKRQKE